MILMTCAMPATLQWVSNQPHLGSLCAQWGWWCEEQTNNQLTWGKWDIFMTNRCSRSLIHLYDLCKTVNEQPEFRSVTRCLDCGLAVDCCLGVFWCSTVRTAAANRRLSLPSWHPLAKLVALGTACLWHFATSPSQGIVAFLAGSLQISSKFKVQTSSEWSYVWCRP